MLNPWDRSIVASLSLGDANPEHLIAQVDSRVGQAADVLQTLVSEGRKFDVVFLDADKQKYIAYYDAILGVWLFDALWQCSALCC